ncbi:hypothetical protein BJ912DRAFT_1057603 [Pholiota molesta]|nr:hypothetical protein BJ912DRAFT_1057603 [Pholiota molesta]
MTPAAHNVTPNHRQRRPQHRLCMDHIAPTSCHIVPPCRDDARCVTPLAHAPRRWMKGVGNGRGDPGAGDPPGTPLYALHPRSPLTPIPSPQLCCTATRSCTSAAGSCALPRHHDEATCSNQSVGGAPATTHPSRHNGETTRRQNNATAKPRDGETMRRQNHAMVKPRPDATAHAWQNNASALTVYTYNKCCICSTMRRGDASCQVLPHPQFPVATALSHLPCAEYSQVYLWVLVRTRTLASTRKLADTCEF